MELAFPNRNDIAQPGMTLRDYFAAKALQGLLAAPDTASVDNFAWAAYQHADLMMKEREKVNG